MSNTAVFEDIANEIKLLIHDGTYNMNQKLPSEYDLAKQFDVSRLTIRKAIDLLIKQNIVVKHRGRGTYPMNYTSKIQSGRDGLVSFTESAKLYGKTSSSKIIVFDEQPNVPKEVLDNLDTSEEDIIHLARLRYFDHDPMTVEELYIPKKYLTFQKINELEHSLFSIIEKQVDISYSHQEVEATLVDEKLHHLMELAIGDPILLVKTLTFSAAGLPILFDNSYYRADKYSFKNTLHR